MNLASMPIVRETLDATKFNRGTALPYQLRLEDFALMMQDICEFFFDVNTHPFDKVRIPTHLERQANWWKGSG